STYLGGGGDDAAIARSLDASANIYVAGTTRSTDFPQKNALSAQFGSAASNFVAELNSDASTLVYSTYFADAQTSITAASASATGTLYLAGTTSSTSFPTVRNGTTPTLTAAFTSPAASATVSGTVSIGMSEAGASGAPITFTLTVDGGQVFTASGNAATATFAWTTTTVADGPHTLGLTVRDGAGRTATATRNVTVGGGGTLKAFITSPAAGATVNGTVWSDVWVEGAAAGARTFTLAIGGVTLASTSDASNHVTLAWDST